MDEFHPFRLNGRYKWPWSSMHIGDSVTIVCTSRTMVSHAASCAGSYAVADGSQRLVTSSLGRGADGMYRLLVRCVDASALLEEARVRAMLAQAARSGLFTPK